MSIFVIDVMNHYGYDIYFLLLFNYLFTQVPIGESCQLLLSLLPPSCMVAPKRELVNTLFPFTINLQSSLQEPSTAISMDIVINTPRDQSTCTSSNSSREVYASFITYVDWIQAMANNRTWAELWYSKLQDMSNFNTTSNPHGYLALFVKICSHLYLFPPPNYLLQTLKITWTLWSFLQSELLFNVSLLKHLLGDLS